MQGDLIWQKNMPLQGKGGSELNFGLFSIGKRCGDLVAAPSPHPGCVMSGHNVAMVWHKSRFQMKVVDLASNLHSVSSARFCIASLLSARKIGNTGDVCDRKSHCRTWPVSSRHWLCGHGLCLLPHTRLTKPYLTRLDLQCGESGIRGCS